MATLECTLVDDTGGLAVIFMGRRRIGGVRLGARLAVEGTVIETRGRHSANAGSQLPSQGACRSDAVCRDGSGRGRKARGCSRGRQKIQSLELTLVDGTGGLTVVFLGRRHIGGIKLGARLVVEGTVAETRNQLALLNPGVRAPWPRGSLPY